MINTEPHELVYGFRHTPYVYEFLLQDEGSQNKLKILNQFCKEDLTTYSWEKIHEMKMNWEDEDAGWQSEPRVCIGEMKWRTALPRWSWKNKLGRTFVSGEITLKDTNVPTRPDWMVEIIFTMIEQCGRTHCRSMKPVSLGLEQTAILYNTNTRTVNKYVSSLLTVNLICQQNLLIKRHIT